MHQSSSEQEDRDRDQSLQKNHLEPKQERKENEIKSKLNSCFEERR
jgi:hypothetical protein